jgi:hypothetical protein
MNATERERWTYITILGLWPDHGHKIQGFFSISKKFLIDEIPLCRILKFWEFGWTEKWATGADVHESQIQDNF